MVDFPSAVNPPGGASYSAPLLNFAAFGDWGKDFEQGRLAKQQEEENRQRQLLNQQLLQRGQQQQDLSQTFQGGLPRDAQGNIDYSKVAAMLAQKGDIGALTSMAPMIAQQQAGSTPMWPPQGGQGGGAPASVQAKPLPPPSANSPQGDPGTGTLVDLVTARLPSQNQTTGETIGKIAQTMGVDPNAVLTPGQQRRAQGLLQKYAGADSGGDGGSLPPSANAGTPAPKPAAPDSGRPLPAQGQPQPAPIGAGQPGAPPPAQPPQAGPAAPQPQQPQGGPITPQVPLPPGFTDPQQAAMALRKRAADIESANPKTKPKADELRDWAGKIEQSIAPLSVGQLTTIVDPRTGKALYQGPGAAAMSGTGSGATIDADAERYRQTGTLPPNMGRGIQGQHEAAAIRARAAEQEINAGGDPAKWPDRWQDYRARGVGKSTAERVKAGREENLNLILKAADAAIPAALEASKALPRGQYVPLNKLIQKGEIMSSDPRLVEFGMANLQLAEHWARAMNPTGVMRESDRDKALTFLDTGFANNTYERAVMQLQKQITRERDAVRGGGTILKDSKAPEPGEEGKAKPDADGWITMPNGARVQEVK